MLTQFQNCGQTTFTSSIPSTQSGGGVRIVDDFNKTEIQFVTQHIQIHDEVERTNLVGFCNRSHTGSQLRWAVWADDRSGQPLAAGNAECQSGQFAVKLEGLTELVCGVDHVIMIEGDWGGSAIANFNRRCQPLASELVLPPSNSPVGTACSLEYQIETISSTPCTQVCYRDDKVISILPVDQSMCSGLAAKLAGP